jgi:outer membrane protein W
VAVVLLLGGATAVRAQGASSPVSRADASGSFGWLNADKSNLTPDRDGNDWYNTSAYGGVSFGWYWTDHLKTEIEAGVSSAADVNVYTSGVIDGRLNTIYSTYTFSTSRLGIGQQYQFYRNVWFHPFVGAGLDLTWERSRRRDEFYSAAPVRNQPFPTETDLLVRPFATLGFKAYFTQKAFFRTDMRLAFDKGVDEALLRFGFGVDF